MVHVDNSKGIKIKFGDKNFRKKSSKRFLMTYLKAIHFSSVRLSGPWAGSVSGVPEGHRQVSLPSAVVWLSAVNSPLFGYP